MAFDGAFLHTVLSELNTAAGAFVEKIYQPGREELLISLKKKDFSAKLLITARNGAARIGFTHGKPENPQTPPMFCMLARKIFLPSRFTGAKQKGLERIIELEFEATNELGDKYCPKIICEFIGNSNNIILADENCKIFDAVNRSDITAQRIIMPGAVYRYPDNLGKMNILDSTEDGILDKVRNRGGEVSSALLGVCEGLSPLLCRELCFSAFGTTESYETADFGSLKASLEALKNSVEYNRCYTVLYQNGNPKDFSFIDINQYGTAYTKKYFNSPGEMLDEFYSERDTAARLKKQGGDLLKTVNTLINRANRRMNLRIKDLEATRDRENLRISGELIKSNIHLIKPGDTVAVVQNFYDENLNTVKIKLDPSKSPAANAARYFKEYKKSCAASQSLGALIENDRKEIEYLDSVLFCLEQAKCISDIESIRDELATSGYIKGQKSNKKHDTARDIEEYLSDEGYRILVGRNNAQNDCITTRLADKNDTWFHTKNIHGSHVVVKNGGGRISEKTIFFAASLAAKNSRAKNSSNVPVDYTEIRHVKKPAGAKAGMVIYTTNKTVFVTPSGEKL